MRASVLVLALATAASANKAIDRAARQLGWRNGGPLYTPKGLPTPKYPHPYKNYPAQPEPTAIQPGTPSPNPAFASACVSVSSLAASQTKKHPHATPTVPAQLAYECLASVPFNQSAALALLDSIRPYLDWQTTLQYVINPPPEYRAKVQKPYDFWKYWENINHNAKVHNYRNEYEFGFQLYRLFQMVHDGHFVFIPDSVGLIFNFARTTPLVSISLDGKELPEVYAYADVLEAAFGNATFTPSPITHINGQDSTDFLLTWSSYGSLQDRDALWNNMFYGLAQVALGPSGTGTGTFSGGGRGRWIYPGPATMLTFKNGTSVTTQNYAKVLVPFNHITTGEDLYMQYFVPPAGEPEDALYLATARVSSSSVAAPTATSTKTTTIPAPGYPTPFIRSPDNLNAGYFLEGKGYDDVAVLSLPSFVSIGADETAFQIANTYFLNQAVARGKKKLIIDVSANAGGTILQGYDVFKQLFPSITPYGANRFKAHEAFNMIGKEVSYYSGLVPRSLSSNDTVQDIVSTPWNYRTDDDVHYKPFTSWPDKYGPDKQGPKQEEYTNLLRWNLSDVLTPDNSGGIYVSGYLDRSNITKQPFAAEDIVIVYDGYCASTCTIFSELMTSQAGVRTIALGGRPHKEIIQAVGGTKGTNDYPFSQILFGVELPFEIAHYHNRTYYNHSILGTYSDLPMYRSIDAVVNARDGIAPDDKTETPLQFIYQPADCRIYYTPEMVVDETALWKTVADTAFGGKNHCVAGGFKSTKNSNSADEKKSNNNNNNKRDAEQKQHEHVGKHAIRDDIDIAAHFRALGEVWTGVGGTVSTGGDCYMLA